MAVNSQPAAVMVRTASEKCLTAYEVGLEVLKIVDTACKSSENDTVIKF